MKNKFFTLLFLIAANTGLIKADIITIDGDFSDWAQLPLEYIAEASMDENSVYESLYKIKICYYGEDLYFYAEYDASNACHFNFFLDTDCSPYTGMDLWLWENAGIDYVMEWVIENGTYSPGFLKYVGSGGDDWDFSQVENGSSISSYAIAQLTNGNKAIEGKTTNFKTIFYENNPSQYNRLKVGVVAFTEDWQEAGCLPQRTFTEEGNVPQPMLEVQFVAPAYGACGENLTWEWNEANKTLTFSGFGDMNNYSSSNKCPWTPFVPYIQAVVLPNGITSIGDYAFHGCNGLTSISIPNSITSIGEWAFARCSSLTSITIPNSVTSIGDYAFDDCSGLTSITIPNSVTSIGNGTFSYCNNLTSVTLPIGITSIGKYLFHGCSGLTSVSIPNSITSIGEYAFYVCSNLTSINIPNSVTSIGAGAFAGCSSLTSIDIPNSVTLIMEYAFGGCIGLKALEFPTSLLCLQENVFYECSNLETIKIPSSVLSLGEAYRIEGELEEEYFSYRSTVAGDIRYDSYYGYYIYGDHASLPNLKHVEAPAWFFDVPENYWSSCPKYLDTVVVNRGELNDNALGVISRSYKTLKMLDVSGVSNTELDDEAFNGYYNLQTLVLPANLTKIGYMAVAGCTDLTSIVIPASVTEIGKRAFENCRSMVSVTFAGSALTSIGNWAFFQCLKLQNIVIPEGVTEIGDAAFYGCTYLANVVVPSSVSSIGDNAFALCSKMAKMQVRAAVPPSIANKTFDEVSRQMPVYVPLNSVNAYKADPLWGQMNIIGADEQFDAVDNVTTSAVITKQLRNGQLLILRDGKTYTIQGQEVK